MLASSMSLVDRRQLLNTAAASILMSPSPSNSDLMTIGGIIGDEASRLSLNVATAKKGIVSISVPKIGYSLYKTDAGQAETCVQLALQAGYRHFDLATQYGTNEQVGNVLRSYLTGTATFSVTAEKADLTQRERRSELFLSHKISNEEQSTKIRNVKNAVKQQMKQLSVGYLDLCSIHSPLTDPDRRLATYVALLELQDEGVVKAIGVCNYGVNPLSKYG
jgi:2,5-diketo-D-gluconate reductase A